MANLPPDVYMEKLEAEAGLPGNWLDDIIGTHLIDAGYLRGTDGRGGSLRMMRKPAALNAAPESAADYQQDQSA